MPLLAAMLLGCASPTKPSTSLEPRLGHSQPHSSTSTPAPDQEPPPSDPVPVESPPPSRTDTNEVAPEEPTIPPPAAASEEDEALCRHITTVVLSESGNAAGLTGEQIDELIVSCSLALAHDRRELGEVEFRRRASCVRKASSVEAISACKPN
jgi:hypothetical protein